MGAFGISGRWSFPLEQQPESPLDLKPQERPELLKPKSYSLTP